MRVGLTITHDAAGKLILLAPSGTKTACVGSQYDHLACTLVFTRDPINADDELLLYFDTGRVELGTANEYALPEAVAQKLQSKLEVAFQRNGEELEHSNYIELIHRASTPSSRLTSEPTAGQPVGGGGAGGISDAPVNGKLYGRKDAGWMEIPAAKDGTAGKDGRDGKDGAVGPAGVDGKDGAPGPAGKDGEPGPAGKDGADGKDGAPGADGAPGPAGADGATGPPGLSCPVPVIAADKTAALALSSEHPDTFVIWVG